MTDTDLVAEFFAKGWCRFAFDQTLLKWTDEIRSAAQASVAAPENARWQRCGGTWFVGGNALPNAADGSVAGGSPLPGKALDFIRRDLCWNDFDWDRAQVSVVYPGYPIQMDSESDAAFRYRRQRDAAHVDGVLPEGPDRHRFLRSYHRFILGIPLTEVGHGNSPLVVWERSHEHVRRTLRARFAGQQPAEWERDDITDLYRQMREEIFATCRRIELTAQPGEAWLVHRHALHGIAPWSDAETASATPRTIIYFRPEFSYPQAWLSES